MTQSQTCAYEYTVRRGDSFYLIAHRLGVPLKDLLEANSSINPARLMVGDVLCIPVTGETTEPETPTVPETPTTPETPEVPNTPDADTDTPAADLNAPATPGGELPEIGVCAEADRYTVLAGETVTEIQLKKNVNLHTLELANPGTDLENLRAGQVLCVPENVACETEATYRLGREETMETTALLMNVSLAALLRANPCLAPSDFREGVCVRIPGE